jgi:bifunctional enzyme CysN/CysC
MLVHVHNVPHVGRRLDAMLVWMSSEPLDPAGQYMIKHSTRMVPGQLVDLRYRIDVNTLHRHPAGTLELNEIGRCLIELSRPVPHDPYSRNRHTGAFVVIDRITHNTVAAGMILDREPNELQVEPARRVGEARSRNVRSREGEVSAEQRARRLGQQPATVWLTGLTGSGKTTIAFELERRLFADGLLPQVLDGENLRLGLNRDLAFGADDRAENIRRAGEVARLVNQAGLICICSLVSPYRADRELVARRIGAERFIEVYLSAPLAVCRERAREVYAKAESGEVPMFSGVSAPYEPPASPALALPTHELDVDECVERILALLGERGIIPA